MDQAIDIIDMLMDSNNDENASLSSTDSAVDSLTALNINKDSDGQQSQPLSSSPPRSSRLGFEPQKEIIFNRYLPYSEQIDAESVEFLARIKANFSRAVVLNDRYGLQWITDLTKYLRLYGLCFSKSDHLFFIRTLYELIQTDGLELQLVAQFSNVLTVLLKKRELISREDLTLEWRPLYRLYERTLYSKYESLGMLFIPDNYENSLKSLVRASRVYFSVASTAEMLDEWRPALCPFDTEMIKAAAYMELFLPTSLPPEHHDQGFRLWFDELMSIWTAAQNTPAWEQSFISLFARMANDTIGYLDWRPYIPSIFTHLIRSFNLAGGPTKVSIMRGYNVFHINSVVLWLVAMLGGGTGGDQQSDNTCQSHITKLFKACESYYHPSNTGKWNLKLQQLLFKLPATFVARLHRERFKRPSWRTPIPESHRLTESDIDSFVQSLTNVVMIAMFSRWGSIESATAFQSLSLLRPELVCPPVLDKLYSALETLTEPHRLSASMQCVVSIARALVASDNPKYSDGRLHVLPLLLNSLDGLDVNDMRKCMVTFQFIATFVTLVPLIDCSAAVDTRTDLTDTESQLCLASVECEDFVLQFMDRCFVLIENSQSLDQSSRGLDRQDNDVRMNTEEGIIEVGLASTFGSILQQSSPQIFKSALDKLYQFISTHIFETKVAGKFAAILVRSCSKANAELSLSRFLPHFCRLVLTLTENDEILSEEFLDHELLFAMQIISELVRCDGRQLLPYADLIVKVVDRTVRLKCRKGYLLASAIIKHVLKSSTLLFAIDFKSIAKDWSSYGKFDGNDLPIRDWGCTVDIKDLSCRWHESTTEELAFAQRLLDRYLSAELSALTEWMAGQRPLSREDLQRSLLVILDCITGAASALPLWDGDNICLRESLVPLNTSVVDNVGAKVLTFSDGSNVRQTVLKTLRSALTHIIDNCEDDTKSLCRLIRIYHQMMFFWGISKQDFDTRWKGFHMVKKSLENRLSRKKHTIRALTVDRLMLQHEMRVTYKSLTKFTELHQQLMSDLVQLATSHYSEVRCQAQETLFTCFRSFQRSYRLPLPKLLANLSPAADGSSGVDDDNHEQFKGTLYVILGRKGNSLLTAADWSTLRAVWPALVNARHSEKPSIIRLLDLEITGHLRKYFDTLSMSTTVSDQCVEQARKVWSDDDCSPRPAGQCPTDTEIASARQLAANRHRDNLKQYHELVDQLVTSMNTSDLHWRYYQLSAVMLSMLIRHDLPLPDSAVDLFTKNLIHDTLYIRKISIASFGAIMRQMKRPHPKHPMLASTQPIDNNQWLQTDLSLSLTTEAEFRSFVFVDKPHIGFYCFPKPLMVYDINPSQSELKSMNKSEKIVFNYFSDQSFLDRLLTFLSLEENKGKDKFSSKRFQLWKGVFRQFGAQNLDLLMPRITESVNGLQESAHRCSAEIIAGCLRGSKHWSFGDLQTARTRLEPIVRQVYSNITTETLGDWGTCSATIFENRDARRMVWLLDVLMADPLGSGGVDGVVANKTTTTTTTTTTVSSFLQASRLYLLHGAVQQQEWRAMKLLDQLLGYLERDNHLLHSYQNVRERIGSLLSNVFMFDIRIPSLPSTYDLSPNRSAFVDRILPRLELLTKSVDTTNSTDGKRSESGGGGVSVLNGFTDQQQQERKDAANLLKTICKWIVGNVSRVAYSAPPELFRFLPILCLMQSETSDEELIRETFVAIIMLSHALLTPESIQVAIDTSKQITMATNWHARSAIATFLQYMVSSNMFVLMANPEWTRDIRRMIINLLSDERTEVRESTAETLSGLVHCEFIKIDGQLIREFELTAQRRLSKVRQSNGTSIVAPKELYERHGAILGLCACINAFPYDVPDFMPDILVFLSRHLSDPQPIPTTIKKTLSNFRRTHNDSWRDHKLKFTDDQLAVITDLLVSPNYYA
ncbi:proteasome activator complex subunit 4B-like [Oppia nitens]|uniref:proteasome activator complex subunit 4B-like n=1 Tax=Oppia nitens TaxID=1686743 RepID=UPI0023D97F5E|nr:proteasome activator complex subunit 4B-like [Oppia nitens]